MKRRLSRLTLIAVPILLVLTLGMIRLGAFLVREDPLQHADAIIVLGGTMYERQMEAVDLFKAGYAPRIYLFREIADYGERLLVERGVPYLRAVDVQIDAMVRLGVPREAISILDQAGSTAHEAEFVRDLVTTQHLARVIIVTSKQHTRRARMVMSRHLAGTTATIVMRASRYDLAPVDQWWTERATIRFTLFETQKLLGYWVGLAD